MLNSPGLLRPGDAPLPGDRRSSPCAPARHGEEERYIEVVEIALADVDAMIASGDARRRADRASDCSWPATRWRDRGPLTAVSDAAPGA